MKLVLSGLSICLALLIAAINPVLAAYPLLPPEGGSGTLYALENECACVLVISADGSTVNVLVTTAALATLLSIPEANVDLDESGIVTTNTGSIIFAVNNDPPGNPSIDSSIVERSSDGVLSIVATASDILAATGDSSTELEGLVIGNDGLLYTVDSDSKSLLQINPATGAVSQFVSEADFESLILGGAFSGERALAADENFIYVGDDGIPDVVYRVDYVGNAEIFTGGPGVDPTVLTPAFGEIWIPDAVDGGTFTLFISAAGTFMNADSVAWNGTTTDLQNAIDSATPMPGDVSVTGSGTEVDPWILTWNVAGGLGGWSDGLTIGGEFPPPGHLEVVSDPFRQVNANSHIEAIATRAANGTLNIVFDDEDFPNDINANWNVGDDASTVQTALENAGVTPGDVSVTGSGILTNPWVFTFGMGRALREQEAFVNGGTVPRSDILIGTLIDADAFNGVRGYMTRSSTGSIILQDGSNDALYEVDTETGTSTLFKSEWEFEAFDGRSNDLDQGLAYDKDGNLFVASTETAAILKIEPSGALSTFVTKAQISAATGENDAEIFGIAFERGTATPADGIEAIIAAIEQLVDDGDLKRGQGNGLIRPLENALRSLDRGKVNPACSQVQDFIDKANEKITDGALEASDGTPLIIAAQGVRNQLGCL